MGLVLVSSMRKILSVSFVNFYLYALNVTWKKENKSTDTQTVLLRFYCSSEIVLSVVLKI